MDTLRYSTYRRQISILISSHQSVAHGRSASLSPQLCDEHMVISFIGWLLLRCWLFRSVRLLGMGEWGLPSRRAAIEFGLSGSDRVVFCRRSAIIFSFLDSTQQGGRRYRAVGIYVKTMLLFFKGFPADSRWSDFSLPEVIVAIYTENFMLNLKLRHFVLRLRFYLGGSSCTQAITFV